MTPDNFRPNSTETSKDKVFDALKTHFPAIFGQDANNSIKELFKGAGVLRYSRKYNFEWFHDDAISVEARHLSGTFRSAEIRSFIKEESKNPYWYTAVYLSIASDNPASKTDLALIWKSDPEKPSDSVYCNFPGKVDFCSWISPAKIKVKCLGADNYKEVLDLENQPTAIDYSVQYDKYPKPPQTGWGRKVTFTLSSANIVGDNTVSFNWKGFPDKDKESSLTVPVVILPTDLYK